MRLLAATIFILAIAASSDARAGGDAPTTEPARGPIQQAVDLLDQGKPRQAAAKLAEPLRSRDPYTKAAAEYYAGHCLNRLKQYEKAAAMWTSIASPASAGSASRQVAYWHYAGRLEAIQLYLHRRVKLPKGMAQSALYDELETILNDPPAVAIQARAAVWLGQRADKAGQEDRAQRYYKQGLSLLKHLPAGSSYITTGKPELEATLTKLLDRIQKRKERREAAEKAKALRSRTQIAVDKAVLEARDAALDKKYDDAVRALNRALRIDPDNAEADDWRYRIGAYLLHSGADHRAIAYWQRFIEANPTGRYRAQALIDMADHSLFDQYDVRSARTRLDAVARSIRHLAANAPVASDAEASSDSDPIVIQDNPFHLPFLLRPQFAVLPPRGSRPTARC